jgi:hypothetical protein
MGCGASRAAHLRPLLAADGRAPHPTAQRTEWRLPLPAHVHDPDGRHWRALEERARRAEQENARLREWVHELTSLPSAATADLVTLGGQQPPPIDRPPSLGGRQRAPMPQPTSGPRAQQGDALEWGTALDGRHWSTPTDMVGPEWRHWPPPLPSPQAEDQEQKLLAVLSRWLSTTAAGVAHEQVQAFLSNDDMCPHDALPDAPPAIVGAAVRFHGLRLQARRARYVASAAAIGELGLAAYAGDLGVVRAACLERRADPNRPSRLDGRTALWLAAEAGHTEVVSILAEHGGRDNMEGRHDMEGYHGAGWGSAGMLEARGCTALYGAGTRAVHAAQPAAERRGGGEGGLQR